MAIQKKSLIGGAAVKSKDAGGVSGSKPGAELAEPVKGYTAKKLAVAKLATAKLSTAKLRTLRRLS